MKMKILFIIPNYPVPSRNYLILPPLELTTISASLIEHGHEVRMIDMRIDNSEIEDIFDQLGEQYDFMCIESEFTNYCYANELIKLSKHIHPDAFVGVHGEVGTLVNKILLERNSELDFVLLHEIEIVFPMLLNAISNRESYKDIPNLSYRKGNNVYTTKVEFLQNINELPKANRNIFNMSKYLARDTETIVRASRGCPGHCNFCIKTKCSKFRIFSVTRFFDEVEELISMGFKSFFFSDDTFSFSDKRVDEICDEIERRNLNIRWTSNMRIKDINEYKIEKMKKHGAYRVFVGIETINASSSKAVNKNLTEEMIKEKINILKTYKIEFHASFILGCPGDTEDDLYRTFDFINEIKPTIITLNKLKVYPGTDIYDHCEKYEVIMADPYWYENDEWSKYTQFGTKLLPPSKIDELWMKGMKSFFLHNN